MKNPFLELYSLMGEATKVEASFFIAKVISPLPDLKVQLNDIVLDKDILEIANTEADSIINEGKIFTESYKGLYEMVDTNYQTRKDYLN